MSPGRARTRGARSGDEHTNHEATARYEYRLPVGKKLDKIILLHDKTT